MNPTNFPKIAGTYALLLRVDAPVVLQIGKLGEWVCDVGDYAYIGSAHGPGGLHARLSRHLRPDKKLHWHIDYLTAVAPITAIWWRAVPERLECIWVRKLAALSAAHVPMPGFGSSDCECESHLFRLAAEGIKRAYTALDQPQVSVR